MRSKSVAVRANMVAFSTAVLVFWSVLGALGPGNSVLAQATLVVDDDGFASAADCDDASTAAFLTISAAEAAASPGDTIMVCPGIYNEQVSINVSNLTIVGAKAGVDARTRAFVAADESIIDHPCGPVQIAADNVVLDGFTVQGSTQSDPCFIAGIWTNPGGTGTNGGHQILNNIVQANIFGIFLNSNCTYPTLVQFNLVQNNNNPGPGSGNGIESELGLCNGTIDSNKFSGHTNASVLVFGATNLNVTNNELVGGSPGARIVFVDVVTGTISGNVSVGSTAVNGTIRLFSGNTDITVDDNTLLNGIIGIRVGTGANSGVEAHGNCIQDNTVAGMQVDTGAHPPMLNAENNWWGDPSGPTHPSNPGGTGDAIIDPDGVVDPVPFLTTPPPLPSCPAPPLPTEGKGTGGGQVQGASFGFNAQVKGGVSSGHFEFNERGGLNHHCDVTLVTFVSATVIEFDVSCNTGTGHVRAEDNQKQGSGAGADTLTFTLSTKGGTLIRGQITVHN